MMGLQQDWSYNVTDLPPGKLPLDWESLVPGQLVEVWAPGRTPFQAYFDERTGDAQAVWLIERGMGSRRLFLIDEACLCLVSS
ncbi:hypothetical protein [Arthrobacter sp. Cr_A7]|uniref:hypothetical protein n=1 Tax=Arthrobacter sp. Cr_A7 TaxID=3031017 RepID=UPI0023D9BE37|nr:hypothetical protein [Arthrobacter sp. Cr_A7]MDF2050477.1 hypothetical protein [Arthrobacter sp. Cr_A7]